MSLVTIQRSPSPTDINADLTDNISEISTGDNLNEDFFASKATVILQNQIGRRRSSVIKAEDTLQCNLKKILELLKKEDSLKLMVNLEKINWKTDGFRYFCLISRHRKQDTDEYLILGVNVSVGLATIGFVQPIHQDMSVALDGDGGFKIQSKDGEKLFKPTSVHALWSTVQLLNKACVSADKNNYYQGGLNHSWINYYCSMIRSTRGQIAEWNKMLGADSVVNSNLAPKSGIGEYVIGTEMDERTKNQETIRTYLEEIMKDEDMDNVTVTFLREKLQEKVSFKLNEYRSFIAEEILIIYGKMDEANLILPYLFLGSTYNASNLEELVKNKISHILNVTRESENFFREKFTYKNVEVLDEEDTKLLKYFDPCHKFINKARNQNGACLVHCQRGISRSASIVISYMMKEFNLTLSDALNRVKESRDCIRPNDGFLQQLKTYEGILQASSQRHNLKFKNDRSNIKSFPNEFFDSSEKDTFVESPTYSLPSNNKRASLGNVYRSQSIITDTSDPVAFNEDADQIHLEFDNTIEREDLNINEDLFVFKDLDANIPNSLSIHATLTGDYSTANPSDNHNKIIDEVLPTDAYQNNVDNTSKDPNVVLPLENNSSAHQCEKKPLKVKSDHSWIKPSSNGNDEASNTDNIIRPKSYISSVDDRSENLSDSSSAKIHRHSNPQHQINDVDQQSQRPVKELRDIYKKQ